MSAAWLTLMLAGLLEVVWAVGLKQTDGFTRPWPTLVTLAAMTASVVLLARALRELPVGTAYAVWTGIGAVGVAIVGIVALGEESSPVRIASILAIVGGIAGLKLSG